MALTPKERARIIEEEQLRFETRQTLHRESCAQHRPRRWLWRIAIVVLLLAAWCHFSCGGFAACHRGAWMGANGHHCLYQGEGAEGGVAPGQPIPQEAPKK